VTIPPATTRRARKKEAERREGWERKSRVECGRVE